MTDDIGLTHEEQEQLFSVLYPTSDYLAIRARVVPVVEQIVGERLRVATQALRQQRAEDTERISELRVALANIMDDRDVCARGERNLKALLADLVDETCPSHLAFQPGCPVCRAVQLLERLP